MNTVRLLLGEYCYRCVLSETEMRITTVRLNDIYVSNISPLFQNNVSNVQSNSVTTSAKSKNKSYDTLSILILSIIDLYAIVIMKFGTLCAFDRIKSKILSIRYLALKCIFVGCYKVLFIIRDFWLMTQKFTIKIWKNALINNKCMNITIIAENIYDISVTELVNSVR